MSVGMRRVDQRSMPSLTPPMMMPTVMTMKIAIRDRFLEVLNSVSQLPALSMPSTFSG